MSAPAPSVRLLTIQERQAQSLFERLRLLIPVEDLDSPDLLALCRSGQKWKPTKTGPTFPVQDQPVPDLILVLTGEIIETRQRGNKTRILRFLGPGAVLGLEGFSQNASLVSYQAMDTSSACRVPWNKVQELARSHPQLLSWMIKLQHQRLAQFEGSIALMTSGPVEQRLARLLIKLDQLFGIHDVRGRFLKIRLTRGKLGQAIDCRTETVIRVLTTWQRQGVVESVNGGKTLILADLAFLQSMAA